MSELSQFHASIETLAIQLDKLLKVINHSDPSADHMKHLLYEKYKAKITEIAQLVKQQISWAVFYEYLIGLQKKGSLSIPPENQTVIIKKLIRDFEDIFVVKHKLFEFEEPEPVDIRQQNRLRKIRKQIRSNRKIKEPEVNHGDLYEMMQQKHQQKAAKRNLDRLVKAMNKINPQEIEEKVNPSK